VAPATNTADTQLTSFISAPVIYHLFKGKLWSRVERERGKVKVKKERFSVTFLSLWFESNEKKNK
jgi:hypothetical protein